MGDFLTFIGNSIALVLIALGLFAAAYKIFVHVGPLIAAPVYATLIVIELLFSNLGQKQPPRFTRFNRPSSIHGQLVMDLFASLTLLLGITLAALADRPDTIDFFKALLHGSLWPQPFMWLFISGFAGLHIASQCSPEDTTHPLSKLKALGLPKAAREYLGIDG